MWQLLIKTLLVLQELGTLVSLLNSAEVTADLRETNTFFKALNGALLFIDSKVVVFLDPGLPRPFDFCEPSCSSPVALTVWASKAVKVVSQDRAVNSKPMRFWEWPGWWLNLMEETYFHPRDPSPSPHLDPSAFPTHHLLEWQNTKGRKGGSWVYLL